MVDLTGFLDLLRLLSLLATVALVSAISTLYLTSAPLPKWIHRIIQVDTYWFKSTPLELDSIVQTIGDVEVGSYSSVQVGIFQTLGDES